jgi:hypothetical protein
VGKWLGGGGGSRPSSGKRGGGGGGGGRGGGSGGGVQGAQGGGGDTPWGLQGDTGGVGGGATPDTPWSVLVRALKSSAHVKVEAIGSSSALTLTESDIQCGTHKVGIYLLNPLIYTTFTY